MFAEPWLRDTFSLPERAAEVLGGVLQVLLVVVVAFVAARLMRRLVRRLGEKLTDGGGIDAAISRRGPRDVPSRSSQRVDAIVGVASSIGTTVVWTIAALAVLATVGVDVGPLLASAGIVGIALGFGAQQVVGDFLNGFFMLVEDQYAVGDIIDAGEASGVVEYIGLRTTRVRDVAGTLWHIPNGEIRRVGNMSQEWARAMLDVRVGYDADLPTAIDVIRATATGLWQSDEEEWSHMILEEPAVWGVEEFGDSAIAIRLVVKTRPGDQWNVARELRLRLKAALASAGVEIPFPQRTVWLRTDQEGAGLPTIGTLPVEQDGSGHVQAAALADDVDEDQRTPVDRAAGAAEEESRRSAVKQADEYEERDVRREDAEASERVMDEERPGTDPGDDGQR